MSFYLYLYCNRLIYWKEYQAFYKPVGDINHLNWYVFHGPPPLEPDEMIKAENYSFSLQRGFFTLEQDVLPPAWAEREGIVRVIKTLEKMNGLANTQKMRYTDNSVGRSLIDVLTIEEVREYQRTKSLENCHILTSLIETSEDKLTPDALVTKVWLEYESYRTVVALLNRLEFEIRSLLKQRKYEEADQRLSQEFEKMRV